MKYKLYNIASNAFVSKNVQQNILICSTITKLHLTQLLWLKLNFANTIRVWYILRNNDLNDLPVGTYKIKKKGPTQ